MPRVAGQIDRAKNEAILDATSDVIYERGLAAPLDEIARRACVSKQTIYNHYGSKAGLVRALIERRTKQIGAPLDMPGADEHPEQALAAYARKLLETIAMERGIALFRLLIAAAAREAELASIMLPGGVRGTRVQLTSFLERETRAGRLAIANVGEAADFFAGMVISHHQVQALLGLPSELSAERIDRIAREAARRFVRAYAA
jgi:AcrR family transcriptional regulator